jgi:hypothetical protein
MGHRNIKRLIHSNTDDAALDCESVSVAEGRGFLGGVTEGVVAFYGKNIN